MTVWWGTSFPPTTMLYLTSAETDKGVPLA